MSKKKKVQIPGAAREAGPVDDPKTEVSEVNPEAVEVEPAIDTESETEPAPEVEPEAVANPEQEYPCVAPKASICGAGCVLVAGDKIGPSDIHSDPLAAKEHFDSLVERGLILEKAPE